VSLSIGGRELRAFGSQGQQRTAALAIRLAELRAIASETGEAPILLLDDVMSELDPDRRRQLLAHLKGIQAVITCTDISDLAGADIGMACRVSCAALMEL
jgi:DNA replication and repair protein RecF